MECLLLLLVTLLLSNPLLANNPIPHSPVPHNTVAHPLETPKTNATSLLATIEDELNKPSYYQEILPNNFSYLTQLLEHGKKTGQSREYFESVFRLFTNKIKGAHYVNAFAFNGLLELLPPLTKHQFILYKNNTIAHNLKIFDLELFDRFKQMVNNTLLTQFQTNFDVFKNSPGQFLDQLSLNITEYAQEEISTEQLRQTMIKFIDVCLNKLVWSPDPTTKAWDAYKKSGQLIASLMADSILNDTDQLDDLWWSLTHRFCYFVSLMAKNLPLDFYTTVKQDLFNELLIIASIAEQEPFLETKISCLKRAILTGDAQRRMSEAQ